MTQSPIIIASRGSALALAQANLICAQCRQAFPEQVFEIRIIKTTGDKLQTASMSNPAASLPKGLFTKELEVALLEGTADLAVHSLKDLPTELPAGLCLGAVSRRADVRDVMIYRSDAVPTGPGRRFPAGQTVAQLPQGAVVATSSTRRKAQLLARRPDLEVVEIRGNVATRMQKLADQPGLDATLLAAAGLDRLNFQIGEAGQLSGEAVPEGLCLTRLTLEEMLPCVGQGALGIEVRQNDERLAAICDQLNDLVTHQCVAAERAFLKAMGGGCQSPVGAYGEVTGKSLRLRAVSFQNGPARHADQSGMAGEPESLGRSVAAVLKGD